MFGSTLPGLLGVRRGPRPETGPISFPGPGPRGPALPAPRPAEAPPGPTSAPGGFRLSGRGAANADVVGPPGPGDPHRGGERAGDRRDAEARHGGLTDPAAG